MLSASSGPERAEAERRFVEGGGARGLLLFVTRRNTLARLHAGRMAIRAAIVELSGRVEG